jgi:hypothetical protein
MFGAFALDVSNFQAGSFGTPAFFLYCPGPDRIEKPQASSDMRRPVYPP